MTADTTMTDVDTSSEAMERMCTAMRLEFPPSVADHIQERVRALAAERDELSMKLNEAAHTAKAALDRCDELERLAVAVRRFYIDHGDDTDPEFKPVYDLLLPMEERLKALEAYQRKGE